MTRFTPDPRITPAPTHRPEDWEDMRPVTARPGEYVRSIYSYGGVTVTVEGHAVTPSSSRLGAADPLWVPFSARPTARYQRLIRKDPRP